MQVKSLLLSSAAILLAATSVQAADAILVEPEPVEYVRICDTYGSGFFYLPGTETCIRISGYVRSTYVHYTEKTGGVENPNHGDWTYRGRLNIDVRNETDWGTLRSQLRLQGDSNGGSDGLVGLDRALISVAGFRVGYSIAYWETAHGSAADSPAIEDGMYNADQSLFVDYTYAADGLAVTVGMQDSNGITSNMESPDYYVGGKYSADWGWFAATYIYDQDGVNASTGLSTGADAWKVSLRLNEIGGSPLGVGAWYMSDGDDASEYVTGGYGADGALVDNQWGVVIDGAVSETLTAYMVYSVADAVSSSASYLETKHLAAGLVWAPIEGLELQFEYYTNESDYVLAANDTETDAFIVRAIRTW